MKESTQDECVYLMMVVKPREVLFDLWCVIPDTIVCNDEVSLCKNRNASRNSTTIASSIIVLTYLTGNKILRNKAVNRR